jgi:hypothetical protein
MGYIAAVIGMGGRSTRDHAHQVAGHNRIRIRSTSAPARLAAERVDAAGSHITDSAANPKLTEAALRLLFLPPVPSRLEFLVVGMLKHFLCSTINAFLIHCSLAFKHSPQRIHSPQSAQKPPRDRAATQEEALECGSLLPLLLRPACWPCTGARYSDR